MNIRINPYSKRVSNINNNAINRSAYKNYSKCSTKTIFKSVQRFLSEPLQELSFKGNVVDIRNGYNYKVKTLMHGYAELSVRSNNSELLLYQLYPSEDIAQLFSEDEFRDIARTNDLIGFLSSGKPLDKIVDLIRIFMPDTRDVGARLQTLGMELGKYFEIKGYSEKLFLGDSGWIYTSQELENLRHGYNDNNFFKMGYTRDSVFTIDGQDYHLNDYGYLNIPEGTICIPSRVEIKK